MVFLGEESDMEAGRMGKMNILEVKDLVRNYKNLLKKGRKYHITHDSEQGKV
jgi:hypothetical protein